MLTQFNNPRIVERDTRYPKTTALPELMFSNARRKNADAAATANTGIDRFVNLKKEGA
jgi:hypothetical protein